eukprot:3229286-Amphidinium_carterae.1
MQTIHMLLINVLPGTFFQRASYGQRHQTRLQASSTPTVQVRTGREVVQNHSTKDTKQPDRNPSIRWIPRYLELGAKVPAILTSTYEAHAPRLREGRAGRRLREGRSGVENSRVPWSQASHAAETTCNQLLQR